MLKRTIYVSEAQANLAGKEVIVNGWVHRIREHGEGLTFINIRDRSGVVQVIVNDKSPSQVRQTAKGLKNEYCIGVRGIVRKRDDSLINKDMITGEVEIEASEIEVFSTCDTLPFAISDDKTQAKEDLRLKYRYLDLRSGKMKDNLILRTRFVTAIRKHLDSKGFLEIETPTLIRSTPEGARDFLVPSRLYEGKFYSLPQSPQLYKQLLMVSGLDRYYQVARCYRDEDARGDRQLEFTQLDLEMSFADREDVLSLMEGLFKDVFKEVVNYDLPDKFVRIPYADAMNSYGCDKPDLRFDCRISDFSEELKASSFEKAKAVVCNGGFAKAIRLPLLDKSKPYSRKQLEEYLEEAKIYKNKTGFFLKAEKEGNGLALSGSAAKFFDAGQQAAIISKFALEEGDALLVVADEKWKAACAQAGSMRSRMGAQLGLTQGKGFAFCWIVDFPLFSYNEELGHWEAEHHMFSRPKKEHMEYLDTDPGKVLGDLYDLVLNGYEVASGSVRINEIELQEKIFEICNYSKERAQKAFGFLLEAFRYGAPPHAGIAPGIDRMCMIIQNETSIKEVIAFPKNTFAVSPMDESPSEVSEEQLRELHLIIDAKERK